MIALTFDACGGGRKHLENDYDRELIAFLREARVPATLFLNQRWIAAHPEDFLDLASDPLFEIENHGTRHCPLSLTGKSAYGIRGTRGREEVVREVETNARYIQALTGRKPLFFRSGTAHYDAEAVRIVRELGFQVAGFSLNGDCGATLKGAEVALRLMKARSGDIILCHMNRPGSGTAKGVRQAVLALRKRGFRFVTLQKLLRGPGK